MNYFVKTFKIKDGGIYTYDRSEIEDYLPEGWEIKGGAKPTITFGPGTVTVAVEVFSR